MTHSNRLDTKIALMAQLIKLALFKHRVAGSSPSKTSFLKFSLWSLPFCNFKNKFDFYQIKLIFDFCSFLKHIISLPFLTFTNCFPNLKIGFRLYFMWCDQRWNDLTWGSIDRYTCIALCTPRVPNLFKVQTNMLYFCFVFPRSDLYIRPISVCHVSNERKQISD